MQSKTQADNLWSVQGSLELIKHRLQKIGKFRFAGGLAWIGLLSKEDSEGLEKKLDSRELLCKSLKKIRTRDYFMEILKIAGLSEVF